MNWIIKNSEKEGSGIFANNEFKKNKLVFIFSGNIINWSKANYKSLQIGKNKFINPDKNNPGEFLNHSCNPNCGIKNLNKITAMKNIKPGEEILIDYSTTIGHKYEIECNCKDSNCRKFIRSYKELPKEIKEKYKGWTSEYLIEK